uniref:FLZ-type domain-containing protein n=1 Tax=Kalanchoe fedtschenkoi TaxID=63787 RepID=A0A7N0V8T3_KALFE
MMLGKRPRHPIKRTASMTEFAFDLNSAAEAPPPPHPDQFQNPFAAGGPLAMRNEILDRRMLAPSLSLSPRNFRRNSADFTAETPHFLRSCSLCKTRLVPGRDIYMYRGNSAFCSADCREKQMKQDERKDKCSLAASKKEAAAAAATAAAATSSGAKSQVSA